MSCTHHAPRCAEIQVRPSREWWLPRTGAERTEVREQMHDHENRIVFRKDHASNKSATASFARPRGRAAL
ncbi:hypothetical protein C7I87_21200 [Mesorhizobium sp. SARCC-RB16n]|nr:hypothetical protein C7I87_21200 [Mesorhizobium sp. SARCC-RB16n]